MKKMKSSVLLTCVGMLVVGCAIFQGTPVPEECQDSILRSNYEYYKAGALVLNLGNIQALEDNNYTKEQALVVFEEIDTMLKNSETTYVELATFILGKIKWVNDNAGVKVFILADFLLDMQNNMAKIHPCDLELMLTDLAKLRMYTNMM